MLNFFKKGILFAIAIILFSACSTKAPHRAFNNSKIKMEKRIVCESCYANISAFDEI